MRKERDHKQTKLSIFKQQERAKRADCRSDIHKLFKHGYEPFTTTQIKAIIEHHFPQHKDLWSITHIGHQMGVLGFIKSPVRMGGSPRYCYMLEPLFPASNRTQFYKEVANAGRKKYNDVKIGNDVQLWINTLIENGVIKSGDHTLDSITKIILDRRSEYRCEPVIEFKKIIAYRLGRLGIECKDGVYRI